MAAYAALISLLNNIHTITNHPHLSTCLDNTPIQPLLQKIGFLLEFIEGNNYDGGREEAQHLERRITCAAHAAEDLIESHIVDHIHMHGHRRSYLKKILHKFVGRHESHKPKEPIHLQQINEYMDAIMRGANDFMERHRLGEQQQPTHLPKPPMQSGESGMVGLDAELIQLLDKLTSDQSTQHIISIVGMGGSGKTTLAKNVYGHLLIKEHFDLLAWATISQQNNAKEILSELLSCIGELGNGTPEYLGLQLHKKLFGRRYFVVLDDIWGVSSWDEVKSFFPNNNNGSSILLTTRLLNVAQDCGSSIFMMNLLDEENSWKLFCEKAFQSEDCPPELRNVGEEIVKLCKGIALSIVVIGGLLLKSPTTVGYWKQVAEDLKSIPNSKEKQESLDVLSLSYNHLPPHLKPCFLYMGVFEEDSKIHISRIIKLWIGEGFIKPIGSRDLEEISEGYINDLINRNLILVCGFRKNGKVRSCSIHDLLRDLCIQLAEQDEFFHVNDNTIRGTERRMVKNWIIESMRGRLPITRSIMSRRCIKQPAKYRLLRVLDEADLAAEMNNYYENVNMRYLAYLRLNWFKSKSKWKLPTSISLMWSLQTLIIQSYARNFLVVAPTECWKIQQLRHVHCNQIYLPRPPRSNKKDGLLILENLRTLKTVVNLRLSDEVCKIIPGIKKLHLLYDYKLYGYS